MKKKILRLLDALVYLIAVIGLFVAAFNHSIIWTMVFGFLLIDEGITFVLYAVINNK